MGSQLLPWLAGGINSEHCAHGWLDLAWIWRALNPKPKKVQDFGSLYLQLACRRTLPLVAGTMCNNINNTSNRNRNFNSNSKRISKKCSPCRRWRER